MSTYNRRDALALLAGSVALPTLVKADETYPSRPVRFVNGFAAGGPTDVLARIYCRKLSEISGQNFIVENKPGASGTIGAGEVARSMPDGYTLGLGSIANNVIAVGSFSKLSYRAGPDFTFLSGIWTVPNVLLVRKDFPANNVKDIISLLKSNPGKYTYASVGVGTTGHLCMEMFKTMAGVDVLHVPYKGTPAAMTDLFAGRVDMMVETMTGATPVVRDGRVLPVAVTSKQRSPIMPDVPAWQEVLPHFELTVWCCMIGPANLPAAIVSRFGEISRQALNDQDLKRQFAELGATPWPTGPAELTKFRDEEEARLLPVMKAAGVAPE